MYKLKVMHILYLHGLESPAGGEKVEYLRMLGHMVESPEIDYTDEKTFNQLRTFIQFAEMEEPVDLIIGSSMGGYFAYELGKYYGIPVLLFNPALHSRPYEPVCKPIDPALASSPLIFLGVGEHDDVIDYTKTLDILDNNVGESFFRGNYWKGDHGHKTPIEFFQKVFANTEERLSKITQ
jgi:hypothetical protein